MLFDLSLSRAGAASVEAGTPPYLDPFLGTATRPHWDSAAERYAATVTLFEMATGLAPKYGDGQSDPAAIKAEASLEPGLFDPSVATPLVGFFRRALRRDARERFHTATEMLTGWRAIFAESGTTVPDDADELAAAAKPETPLAAAGLSARALSALEPLGLNTAGDLAAVDAARLSRLTGVADPTRREVRSRAKQWRERFGAQAGVMANPTPSVGAVDDPVADPAATADLLVRVARSAGRRQCVSTVLGLASGTESGVDAFASLAELAPALGLGGQPQVWRVLADAQEAWAADTEARARLDAILARAVELLSGLGGLSNVDDVVSALAAEHGKADGARLVAGLLRFALDRADIVERGGGDAAPIARRRRRGRRGQIVAMAPALLDVADAMGRRVDDLVTEATSAGEDIVPAGRAAARLRPTWPADVPAPDDIRLVRLAARLSTRSAATRRGELHDRDLDPASAIVIALGGLAPSQRLTPQDLAERVRARFPDLAALPGRPRLDQVVAATRLPMRWDNDAYAVLSRQADTTLASRTPLANFSIVSATGAAATDEDARLADSARSRAFLALGVPPQRLDEATASLVARHGAYVVDVTAVLLRALREEAARRGVPWDAVQAADAAEPGSRPAQGLAALVRGAVPAVEAAITEAAAGAPEGTRPVLLVEAAPLARYEQTEVLTRLADITLRRSQAMWLLLPEGYDGGALLDGVALPLGHGGQFLRLDDDWLRAAALEGKQA